MEAHEVKSESRFKFEKLEERIAPSANLNPGENNTNNTGNRPGDGAGGGNPDNNSPGENDTNNPAIQATRRRSEARPWRLDDKKSDILAFRFDTNYKVHVRLLAGSRSFDLRVPFSRHDAKLSA